LAVHGLPHASHPERLHHLIAQVIDHLHRDSSRLGFIERPRRRRMQRFQASALISAFSVVFGAL
jgi:hypothetical protein